MFHAAKIARFTFLHKTQQMTTPNFRFTLPLLALMLSLFSCYEESFAPNIPLSSIDIVAGQEGEIGTIRENPFVLTAEENTSTFSIDADGGAYANVRRYLEQDGSFPPPEAIRTEELINYFDLGYPFVDTGHPISLNGEVSGCPWSDSSRLIRIGIEGQSIPEQELPFSNFVFLIDVSGSMASPDKLELIKTGMHRFVDQMRDPDHLSIVTYAASTRVYMGSTSGRDKSRIRRAIDRLSTGGGTNGGAGIRLAYDEATENFIPGGNNRIFIATDGDFNVGITDFDELISLIEEKRENGVFLTTLGVGRSNYAEQVLEQIANKGNGTYEYLDKVEQLEKVFFQETGKFYTVAKDVKVQVAFNPDLVKAYRLIGYENRLLDNEDFEDDTEDAGEIGAGQNITALYEIIPVAGADARSAPSFTIDFRYKLPDSDTSVPLSLDITDQGNDFAGASDYSRFTAAVAGFGLVLLDSQYKGSADYDGVLRWLDEVEMEDPHGWIAEFRRLVEQARNM